MIDYARLMLFWAILLRYQLVLFGFYMMLTKAVSPAIYL
jgi:hypothetical protein